jgi:hypothetical protein
VRYLKDKEGKTREKRDLFFSTDAQDLLDIYQARFQIEFYFRYAKHSQVSLTVNLVSLKPLTFTAAWLS